VETDVEDLTSESVELTEWEEFDDSTRAIVTASNRTTHAVRSLALFFFTLLRVNLLGGGLF